MRFLVTYKHFTVKDGCSSMLLTSTLHLLGIEALATGRQMRMWFLVMYSTVQ